MNHKKIRDISIKCCNCPNSTKYINNVCIIIKDLIHDYSIDKNIDFISTLKYYLSGKAIGSNVKSAGQTSEDDILDVISKGNLREKMTIIMNFAMRACNIVIWAICNDHKLINKKQKNKIKKRLYLLTGLNDIKEINKHILECEECILPCKFVSLSKDGSVTASRMNTFPMLESLREPRKNNEKYKLKKNEVYPPLSLREVKYMNLKHYNKYLPWVTGNGYWKVNENNFYIKLMKKYNQDYVCGPSGNTDLQLYVLSLFNNFNIKYGVIACVGWMCNPIDHSPCEILLASLPYSRISWSIKDDSYKYIESLINKYDIK